MLYLNRKVHFTERGNHILQKLKEIRERKKMTQEELAAKSGVSRVTISMLESGAQDDAKASTLAKLADALDEPMESFF